MNYLIVQQWPSTKGNHAGMSHMCDLLVSAHPDEYEKIEIQETLNCPRRKNRLIRAILYPYYKLRYINPFIRRNFSNIEKIVQEATTNDNFFLLEYHLFEAGQNFLAKKIKSIRRSSKIYALSHLSPTKLIQIGFDKKTILKWEQYIDIQLTLGSSLTHFFESIGISPVRIKTGFLYIDDSFYFKDQTIGTNKQNLNAIVIGNIQRNYSLLSEIIKKTPYVNWTICGGHFNLTGKIPSSPNITLKGYVKETELKELMSCSDISVNVVDDTVGSNVITTSMAMGLAIISSDVGSIHDYCTEKNAIFCQNKVDSFTEAIYTVANNATLLKQMQQASIEASKKYSIEKFHNWIKAL